MHLVLCYCLHFIKNMVGMDPGKDFDESEKAIEINTLKLLFCGPTNMLYRFLFSRNIILNGT